MNAISAQVAHNPAILVIAPSMTSPSGRGLAQSIPVDARRCTLSTRIDTATIGTPEASSASNAAYGPASGACGPGKASTSPITPQLRQIISHTIRPSKPDSPTLADTSLVGRGGLASVVGGVGIIASVL